MFMSEFGLDDFNIKIESIVSCMENFLYYLTVTWR